MESESHFDLLIDALKTELRAGVVTVLFIKESTGEPREMVCTLAEKYLPPENPKTAKKDAVKKAPNPDVCVVYDIQQDGWRSFRYDSIVEFRTIDGTYTPHIINKVSVKFTPNGE